MTPTKANQPTPEQCPIAAKVAADILERSKLGFAKYGQTLARTDLSFTDWLQHLYEELLDAANYVKAAQLPSIQSQMERLERCTLTCRGVGLWECTFQFQEETHKTGCFKTPEQALQKAVETVFYCDRNKPQSETESEPQESAFERLERVFNELLVDKIVLTELRNFWRERGGIKQTNLG